MTTRNQTPFRSRAISCFVFRPEAGQIKTLVMKRVGEPMHDQWHQVAGRLEEGEKAWEAALRELSEETALTPGRFYSTGICEQFYSHEIDAIMVMPVFAAFVAKDAQVILNEEHSQFQWLGFQEACAVLPFAGQRRILEQVWQDFVDAEPDELSRIALPL